MLTYRTRIPGDVQEGAQLIILLHGRGTDLHDLLPLASHFPPESIVVTPQGPHPGAPWGYGAGWAWYRHVEENRVESAGLHASLAALDGFLAELPAILPVTPGPLVLGGFSQGGTTSLAYALTRPGTVASVLDLSGFLVDDPEVPVTSNALLGTRIFWGHGTLDMVVPHSLAVSGRALLRSLDADLIEHDYPMGHQICEQELVDIKAWLSGAPRR